VTDIENFADCQPCSEKKTRLTTLWDQYKNGAYAKRSIKRPSNGIGIGISR